MAPQPWDDAGGSEAWVGPVLPGLAEDKGMLTLVYRSVSPRYSSSHAEYLIHFLSSQTVFVLWFP